MSEQENELVTCDGCGTRCEPDDIEYAVEASGSLYDLCENCANNTNYCHYCDERSWSNDLMYYNDVLVCEHCENIRVENERARRHQEPVNTIVQSQTSGKYIKHPILFGVELEVISDDDDIDGLPETCGQTDDSSITPDDSDYEYGIEIVTPILGGLAGENYIEDICEALDNNGARVNSTCGYHLHLDLSKQKEQARPEDVNNIKSLIAFYFAFEDCIIATQPYSRRINTYCNNIRGRINLKHLNSINNWEELEAFWYDIAPNNTETLDIVKSDKYHGSRYAGVNFHSLFYRGSLEIRYHTGTTQPQKVLHWVHLHQSILHYCLNTSYYSVSAVAQKAMLQIDFPKKLEMFFNEIQISPETKNYFITRINKFNNLNICVE